jgi:hypothetical protein
MDEREAAKGYSATEVHRNLGHWHARLKTALQEARTRMMHPGNGGDTNEAAFREFLQNHLSRKYQVGHGEIIDSKGRRSKQVDVAITDDEQPFPVTSSPELLIVEGVTAAAEVKTRLTVEELSDCLEKGRAFKRLEPILGKYLALSGDKLENGVPNSDLVRFYFRRPFFVFAYESVVADQRLLDILQASNQEDEVPPIDALVILDRGFAWNLWDGNGQFKIRLPASEENLKGWFTIWDPEYSLTFLLLWLHASMPRFAMRTSPMLNYLLPNTTFTPNPPGPVAWGTSTEG